MIFNTRGRIITGICVFGGVIFFLYLLLYLPHIRYIESTERQIQRENIRAMQLKKKAEQLSELQTEYRKIQAELSFLEDLIQESENNFLYQLGLRGRIYGISYLEITPQPILEEKYYYRTPIKIHLYGTYHNLGMLLSDMAKRQAPGSFTVDTVLVKEKKEKNYTIEAYLTVSLYEYKISTFIERSTNIPEEEKNGKTPQTIPRRER